MVSGLTKTYVWTSITTHSEAPGGCAQRTKLSKKPTLKLINPTLIIAPTAVTSTTVSNS